MNREKLRKLVITGVLSALIAVMTVVPYTGYMAFGVVEITTLHIVVIVGAVTLGWKAGAFLGGVWGVTCMLRAFTNPLWIMFTNPLISVVPRILVGLVAGLVFAGLRRTRCPASVSALVAAVAATLTNTLLVIGALQAFGGLINSYRAFFEMFQAAFFAVIGVNGVIELVAAAVITPAVCLAVQKANR